MRLNDLPEGRYFDGTYEWDWDGDEWTPLRAPSGMPPMPRLEDLRHRVVTHRLPLNLTPVAKGYRTPLDEALTIIRLWAHGLSERIFELNDIRDEDAALFVATTAAFIRHAADLLEESETMRSARHEEAAG